MYRIIYLLLFISISIHSLATPVTPDKARAKARAFFQSRGKEIATVSRSPQRQRVETSQPYYVFHASDGQGFVIILGDDSRGDILGYSDKGTFDEQDMPENVRYWLSNVGLPLQSSLKVRDSYHEAIAPLISTIWGQGETTAQGSAYNKLCPTVDDKYCLTGCVATAMAQVMRYYQWPEEACAAIPEYSSNEYVGHLDALPQLDFDWEHMMDEYTGTENEQAQTAVAQLMRYCGQAAKTSYNTDKSEAYVSDALLALKNYFGFSPNMRLVKASNYSPAKWEQTIYRELASSRPVIYTGRSSTENHCFICDGYDDNGFFHINWGWGGRYDGFFDLSVLNPDERMTAEGQPDGYTSNANAIIGISRHVLSSDIILFDDPHVKDICVERWDSDGDQELSHKEAEAVISIDDAFRGDTLMTAFDELQYFQNLKSLPQEAFAGCNHLATIIIPEQVKNIKAHAFDGCSALESITIPANVEAIGDKAFFGCSSLSEIQVSSDNPYFNSREDCNAIIETATGTLILGCPTTTIPDGVTSIGASAFEGCTQLEEVLLPESITSIGDRSFYGCSLLREISLPADVTQIGNEALAHCEGMCTIYSFSSTPPTADSDAFEGTTNALLFVPKGAKEAYEGAEEWKRLRIEEMQTEDYMESDDITFKRRNGGTLHVSMTNKNQVIGFQMHLTLPEGMSISKNGDKYDISLSERAMDHSLHCTQQADKSYIILVMSMSLAPMQGNEGEVLSINVEADDSIASGTHEVLFSDLTISIIDQHTITSIYPMPFSSQVTIKDFDMGDANHDTFINVTDVMMIVNHILGNQYSNFHEEDADLDGNGRIDVTDALRVVQLIIDQEVEAPLLAPRGSHQAYLKATAPRTSTLHVDGLSPCTAMQMTITVPEGCKIQEVLLCDERSQGHRIETADIGHGRYKVVIYHLGGLPFRDGDSALLDIKTDIATSAISVSDILCTTSQCETLACPDIHGAVDDITTVLQAEEAPAPCYNLAGQQVRAHYQGIVIQNGKKRLQK